MNLKLLTSAAIIIAFGINPGISNAQNPPAETYQPGFWQPLNRVNPQRPIRVRFVNRTGLNLEYALTTNEAPPRQLPPGEVAVLREIPVPAYFVINPDAPLRQLKYDVTVADNVVTVTMRQISDDLPGDTTFSISETGGIYIY